jgi:cytochrome c
MRLAMVSIAAATALAPLSLKAEGNPQAGKEIFALCGGCHATKAEERITGPHLSGIFGRKAGSLESFKFSDAMRSSGITWDEKSLDQYLADPVKTVKGTTMVVGVRNPKERADIIAYLKTLK